MDYQTFWALKAQLLQQLGADQQASATAFQRAIGLTEDGAVRAYHWQVNSTGRLITGQAMSFYAFGFEGVVDTLDYDKYIYSVIYLPAEIAAQLPLAVYPRLRVEGELNDYPFSGAFIPSAQGHHLILGSARLKAMGLKVGTPVELRFNIADQDGVVVPEELLDALVADEAAQQAWDALTPGKQRGLAYFVGSAKTEATREKRAKETVLGLMGQPGGKLPMQASRTRKS